jgi:NADH-quinone oxidoreductase subunit E
MENLQEKLEALAAAFPEGEAGSLTPFLRAVQSSLNWIPREAMELASERFGVSYPRVYEEASLSPEFSTEPRGDLVILVCRGLACTEVHSAEILKDWEKVLGLREGETSRDGRYSLCLQNCFGRCAIGPNIKIGNNFYSGQKPGEALKLLQDLGLRKDL